MPVKITYIEDQKYGLPEQKKYPMPDKRHVISAIKFFNYVEPKYEKQLAKAILARIEEYGMSFDDFGVGEDNRFSKYIPDQYLAHHGILGQKWGNKNGPPYPLKPSSEATLPANKLSGKNYKKYIKAGAIFAASALAIGGSLYLYKNLQPNYGVGHVIIGPLKDCLSEFPDDNAMSLKKGTTFQRVSAEASQEYMKRGSAYVSTIFRDNAKYISRMPNESWNIGSEMYVHKLKSKTEIKAPSSREAARIFLSVYPLADHSDYINFIKYGIRDDNPTRNTFIGALKKAGFNALIDENDRSWTKAPLILFDPAETCAVSSSHKLHKIEEVIATIVK